MPIQLVVEDLNATLEDKVVLHDVAVTAQAGHVLALMGKTGSGKSTFLRVINRMAEQRGCVVSGRIMLDNSSIFMQEPNDLRRRVGMVFTEPVLFAGTVLHNITAGLASAKSRPSRSARRRRCAAWRSTRSSATCSTRTPRA